MIVRPNAFMVAVALVKGNAMALVQAIAMEDAKVAVLVTARKPVLHSVHADAQVHAVVTVLEIIYLLFNKKQPGRY